MYEVQLSVMDSNYLISSLLFFMIHHNVHGSFQSINLLSIQSIYLLLNQSAFQSNNLPSNQPINLLLNQSTFQSINLPSNQSIYLTINQSTFQSINLPTTQSVYLPLNLPSNHSIYLPINQSISQWINLSLNESIYLSMNQSISQWIINLSVHQPINSLTNPYAIFRSVDPDVGGGWEPSLSNLVNLINILEVQESQNIPRRHPLPSPLTGRPITGAKLTPPFPPPPTPLSPYPNPFSGRMLNRLPWVVYFRSKRFRIFSEIIRNLFFTKKYPIPDRHSELKTPQLEFYILDIFLIAQVSELKAF